jgi:hypothetical protein
MSPDVVWFGWLVLFLIYEVTAALRERGTDKRLTLSRNVWAWFDKAFERMALAIFMAVLTAHLVIGWPGGLAVIVTGIPVAAIIGVSVARGSTVAVVAIAALISLGADKCTISLPGPQPSPTPTSEPVPSPLPSPTPQPSPQCPDPGNREIFACDCYKGTEWVACPTPTPTPAPTPTPPEATECTVPLDGTPIMGAYLLYPRVVDSTPKIQNAARCTAIGMDGRIACPVTPEDGPLAPQRWACEVKLIGGDRPVYRLTVDEGHLAWDYEDMWKARVFGTGRGRIVSCYPNGRACSKPVVLEFK